MNKLNYCLFCDDSEPVMENKLAYARFDKFPVTHLHTLIIPKRHIETYFDMTDEEVIACNKLIHNMKKLIGDTDVKGYNIGTNAGLCAGQTIIHCHIHLIPRREGDMENPRGGVRHCVSGKGYY